MYTRILELNLPAGQSAFLFGARSTGKSTFLKQLYPKAIYYDLLSTDEYQRLLNQPSILREELEQLSEAEKQLPVIIDEVQKIPAILDEVHWLIENQKISFILCGSSARKLKRGAANLLGGRAWHYTFFPLVYPEVPAFNLLKALNQGLLPKIYQSNNSKKDLAAYVNMYLKEEIQAEGIIRNLPGFSRFLDLLGLCNGEMLNYANIARDCGVDAKSVKEYFQILEDTLFGYRIYPYFKKIKRDLITSKPKFYLLDVGVALHLRRSKIISLQGPEAGIAFEHYMLLEIKAFLGMQDIDTEIFYWRTKSGLEVDFILDKGKVAIEVKITDSPRLSDIKGLSAYVEEHKPQHALVVCTATRARKVTTSTGYEITILPWQEFLQNLWTGKYLG